MGKPEIAREYLEKLLANEKTKSGDEVSFSLAYLYAYLNKSDEMFHYLNNSVYEKDNSVLYLQIHPSFKKYRQDPRFDQLIKRLGFK